MNEFSLVAAAGVVTAGVVGYLLLLKQIFRQERRIAALGDKLDLFVQTSIDVARCVDRLVNDGMDPNASATVASRRWLIAEAKQRLARGQQLQDIKVPLGLSKDEVQLLRVGGH